MASKPRLFLDTSAWFAGIWSAEGGERMLLRLGEADVAQLLISSQVLVEIEQVVRRKAEQYLPALALLIDHSRAQVVASAPPELAACCREWVPHPGDAQILADAWQHRADFLVTLDRAHFLDIPGLEAHVPFSLSTPGDCLAWLRAQFDFSPPPVR